MTGEMTPAYADIEVDPGKPVDTDKPFDIDPNNPIVKNIEESVERAAW